MHLRLTDGARLRPPRRCPPRPVPAILGYACCVHHFGAAVRTVVGCLGCRSVATFVTGTTCAACGVLPICCASRSRYGSGCPCGTSSRSPGPPTSRLSAAPISSPALWTIVTAGSLATSPRLNGSHANLSAVIELAGWLACQCALSCTWRCSSWMLCTMPRVQRLCSKPDSDSAWQCQELEAAWEVTPTSICDLALFEGRDGTAARGRLGTRPSLSSTTCQCPPPAAAAPAC